MLPVSFQGSSFPVEENALPDNLTDLFCKQSLRAWLQDVLRDPLPFTPDLFPKIDNKWCVDELICHCLKALPDATLYMSARSFLDVVLSHGSGQKIAKEGMISIFEGELPPLHYIVEFHQDTIPELFQEIKEAFFKAFARHEFHLEVIDKVATFFSAKHNISIAIHVGKLSSVFSLETTRIRFGQDGLLEKFEDFPLELVCPEGIDRLEQAAKGVFEPIDTRWSSTACGVRLLVEHLARGYIPKGVDLRHISFVITKEQLDDWSQKWQIKGAHFAFSCLLHVGWLFEKVDQAHLRSLLLKLDHTKRLPSPFKAILGCLKEKRLDPVSLQVVLKIAVLIGSTGNRVTLFFASDRTLWLKYRNRHTSLSLPSLTTEEIRALGNVQLTDKKQVALRQLCGSFFKLDQFSKHQAPNHVDTSLIHAWVMTLQHSQEPLLHFLSLHLLRLCQANHSFQSALFVLRLQSMENLFGLKISKLRGLHAISKKILGLKNGRCVEDASQNGVLQLLFQNRKYKTALECMELLDFTTSSEENSSIWSDGLIMAMKAHKTNPDFSVALFVDLCAKLFANLSAMSPALQKALFYLMSVADAQQRSTLLKSAGIYVTMVSKKQRRTNKEDWIFAYRLDVESENFFSAKQRLAKIFRLEPPTDRAKEVYLRELLLKILDTQNRLDHDVFNDWLFLIFSKKEAPSLSKKQENLCVRATEKIAFENVHLIQAQLPALFDRVSIILMTRPPDLTAFSIFWKQYTFSQTFSQEASFHSFFIEVLLAATKNTTIQASQIEKLYQTSSLRKEERLSPRHQELLLYLSSLASLDGRLHSAAKMKLQMLFEKTEGSKAVVAAAKEVLQALAGPKKSVDMLWLATQLVKYDATQQEELSKIASSVFDALDPKDDPSFLKECIHATWLASLEGEAAASIKEPLALFAVRVFQSHPRCLLDLGRLAGVFPSVFTDINQWKTLVQKATQAEEVEVVFTLFKALQKRQETDDLTFHECLASCGALLVQKKDVRLLQVLRFMALVLSKEYAPTPLADYLVVWNDLLENTLKVLPELLGKADGKTMPAVALFMAQINSKIQPLKGKITPTTSLTADELSEKEAKGELAFYAHLPELKTIDSLSVCQQFHVLFSYEGRDPSINKFHCLQLDFYHQKIRDSLPCEFLERANEVSHFFDIPHSSSVIKQASDVVVSLLTKLSTSGITISPERQETLFFQLKGLISLEFFLCKARFPVDKVLRALTQNMRFLECHVMAAQLWLMACQANHPFSSWRKRLLYPLVTILSRHYQPKHDLVLQRLLRQFPLPKNLKSKLQTNQKGIDQLIGKHQAISIFMSYHGRLSDRSVTDLLALHLWPPRDSRFFHHNDFTKYFARLISNLGEMTPDDLGSAFYLQSTLISYFFAVVAIKGPAMVLFLENVIENLLLLVEKIDHDSKKTLLDFCAFLLAFQSSDLMKAETHERLLLQLRVVAKKWEHSQFESLVLNIQDNTGVLKNFTGLFIHLQELLVNRQSFENEMSYEEFQTFSSVLQDAVCEMGLCPGLVSLISLQLTTYLPRLATGNKAAILGNTLIDNLLKWYASNDTPPSPVAKKRLLFLVGHGFNALQRCGLGHRDIRDAYSLSIQKLIETDLVALVPKFLVQTIKVLACEPRFSVSDLRWIIESVKLKIDASFYQTHLQSSLEVLFDKKKSTEPWTSKELRTAPRLLLTVLGRELEASRPAIMIRRLKEVKAKMEKAL